MKDFVTKILESIKSDSNLNIIENFNFENNTENQFVIFLKPEVFFPNNKELIRNSLDMIFSKLIDFEVNIDGVVLINGEIMEKYGFMDRHYGFINMLSRKASQIITEDEKNKILQILEINNPEEYNLYGGHEFLSVHQELNAFKLDELWKTKQSMRIRSGFYVQKYDYNGEKVIFVNAFHPVQLEYFTNPNHKTLLMVCNSNRSWSDLKNVLIGNTYPEKALENSIRGEFFANKDKYGIEKVYISANCIHMSAGPFEGLFEMNNFFGNMDEIDFNITSTNVYKDIMANGGDSHKIDYLLSNPKKNIDGKEVSVFDITEDVSTKKSIELTRDF